MGRFLKNPILISKHAFFLCRIVACLILVILCQSSFVVAQDGPGGVGSKMGGALMMWYDFKDNTNNNMLFSVIPPNNITQIKNKVNSNEYLSFFNTNSLRVGYMYSYDQTHPENGINIGEEVGITENSITSPYYPDRTGIFSIGEYIISCNVSGYSLPVFPLKFNSDGCNDMIKIVPDDPNTGFLNRTRQYRTYYSSLINDCYESYDSNTDIKIRYNSETAKTKNILSYLFSANASNDYSINTITATGTTSTASVFSTTSLGNKFQINTTSGESGNIYEILAFDAPLNSAQRHIVYTYLSAKYNTEFPSLVYNPSSPTFHDFVDFTNDIVGIGNNGTENHQLSKSAKLAIEFASTNTGVSYAFIGHNNGNDGNLESNFAPIPVLGLNPLRASARVWHYKETPAGGTTKNPGTITLTFDKDALPADMTGKSPVLVLSSESSFNNPANTEIMELIPNAYGNYTISYDFSDKSYFRIAYLGPGDCATGCVNPSTNPQCYVRDVEYMGQNTGLKTFPSSISQPSNSAILVALETPNNLGTQSFSLSISANNENAAFDLTNIFTCPYLKMLKKTWCLDRSVLQPNPVPPTPNTNDDLRFTIKFNPSSYAVSPPPGYSSYVLIVDESGTGNFWGQKSYFMSKDGDVWVAKNVSIPTGSKIGIAADYLSIATTTPELYDFNASFSDEVACIQIKSSTGTDADRGTEHLEQKIWKYTGNGSSTFKASLNSVGAFNYMQSYTSAYQVPVVLVSSTVDFSSDVRVYGLEPVTQGSTFFESKNDIPINQNEYITYGFVQNYTEDATYTQVVGSMGRANAGYDVSTMKSSTAPEVLLNTDKSVDIGDYAILRHNNGDLNLTVSGSVGGVSYYASDRKWLVSSYGDLGLMNVEVAPTSTALVLPTGTDAYALLLDEDGTGTTITPHLVGLVKQGNRYWAHGIALPNGATFQVVAFQHVITPAHLSDAVVSTDLTNSTTITLKLHDTENVTFASACTTITKQNTLYVRFNTGNIHSFGDASNINATLSFTYQFVKYNGTTPVITQGVTAPISFTIDKTNPERVYSYTFTGDYDEVRIICSSFSKTNNALLNANIRFEAEVVPDNSLQMPVLNASSLITDQVFTLGNTTTEFDKPSSYTFTWNTNHCPVSLYQFQLLRLYHTPDDNATAPASEQDITAVVDWSKALTVDLPNNNIKLTLAEGTGYYAWRVRPIGNAYDGDFADSRNWGNWSTDNPSYEIADKPTLSSTSLASYQNTVFFYSQFNEDKSFIYNRVFTEKGQLHEGFTLANALQQPVQSQTKLVSNQSTSTTDPWGTVLITQTLYDVNARPFVTTLPAPDNTTDMNSELGFRSNFIQYSFVDPNDANSYLTKSVDKYAIEKPSNATVKTPDLINAGILGNYYNTTNATDYVPNAQGFPYTQSKYNTDGTGKVIEQSGVGETFKLTGNHSIKTNYGNPTADELFMLFGDESPVNSSIEKTSVTDQNGIISYSYTDKSGRVIATALLPKKITGSNTALLDLDNATDRTVVDIIEENLPWGSSGLRASAEYVLSQPTVEFKVEYKMGPKLINVICSTLKPCATCAYDIELKVVNLDNGTIVGTVSKPVTGDLLVASACATVPSDVLASITLGSIATPLPAGRYRVEKTASLKAAGEDDVVKNVKEEAVLPFNTIKGQFEALTDIKGIDMLGFDILQANTCGATTGLSACLIDDKGNTLVNSTDWKTYKDGYKLRLTSECCSMDVPLYTYVLEPCKEYNDRVNTGYVKDSVSKYLINFAKQKLGSNYLSFTESYNATDLKSLLENMLEENENFASQSTDFQSKFEVYQGYTCEKMLQSWEAAVYTFAPSPPLPTGVATPGQTGTTDHVIDPVVKNTQLGDFDKSNTSAFSNAPKLVESFLNMTGVAYIGYTENLNQLELKTRAYQLFYYDRSQNSPAIVHKNNIAYYACEIPFCDENMRGLKYFETQNQVKNGQGNVIPKVPDLTLDPTLSDKFCNPILSNCTITATPITNNYTYSTLNVTTSIPVYNLVPIDYSSVKQCFQGMKNATALTGKSNDELAANFSRIEQNVKILEQGDKLTADCEKSCGYASKRDLIEAELKKTYWDNTLNKYLNVSSRALLSNDELQENGDFALADAGWKEWNGSSLVTPTHIDITNGKVNLFATQNNKLFSATALDAGKRYRLFFETKDISESVLPICTLNVLSNTSGTILKSFTHLRASEQYFYQIDNIASNGIGFQLVLPTTYTPLSTDKFELDNVYLRELSYDNAYLELSAEDICCMVDGIVDQCLRDCRLTPQVVTCASPIYESMDVAWYYRTTSNGAWTNLGLTQTGLTNTSSLDLPANTLNGLSNVELKATFNYNSTDPNAPTWSDLCTKTYATACSPCTLKLSVANGMQLFSGSNLMQSSHNYCSGKAIYAPIVTGREIILSPGTQAELETIQAIQTGTISFNKIDPSSAAACSTGYKRFTPWEVVQYNTPSRCTNALPSFSNQTFYLKPNWSYPKRIVKTKDQIITIDGVFKYTTSCPSTQHSEVITFQTDLSFFNSVCNQTYTQIIDIEVDDYENNKIVMLRDGLSNHYDVSIYSSLSGFWQNAPFLKNNFEPRKILKNKNGYIVLGIRTNTNSKELVIRHLNFDLTTNGNEETFCIPKQIDFSSCIYIEGQELSILFTSVMTGMMTSCLSSNISTSSEIGYLDSYLLKLKIESGSLNFDWDKFLNIRMFFDDNYITARSNFIKTLDGGYLIANTKYETGVLSSYYVLKLFNNGQTNWEKTYGGSGYDNAVSVIETPNKYVVYGTSTSSSKNTDPNSIKTHDIIGAYDGWLLFINKDGTYDNERDLVYGGSWLEKPTDILYDKEKDDIYIIGNSQSTCSSQYYQDNISNCNDSYTANGQGYGYIYIAKYSYNTRCQPQDLCYRWIPFNEVSFPPNDLPPPRVTKDQIAVANTIDAISVQLSECAFGKAEEMRQLYRAQCAGSSFQDETKVTYKITQGQYTLYYYDRAGHLVRTVPPEGVELLEMPDETTATNIRDRKVATQHRMVTQYQYNSLGQLVAQQTPDGGSTNFLYNRFGQLRFSQSARQTEYNPQRYSYTKYDKLGRTVETGEAKIPTSLTFNDLNNDFKLDNEFGDFQFPDMYSTDKIERVVTVYSQPAGQVSFRYGPQQNLINRVSYSFAENIVKGTKSATYYSYDPHGNVAWMVQEVPGFSMYHIAYEYDLISNKVTKVKYNEGQVDQFYHRYEYDADNRIVSAFTSTDGVIWDRDANYSYYKHGPLKRSELGEDRVQGLDYIYTLQGWLKYINHPKGPDFDPGKDGVAPNAGGQGVGLDAFGMRLGYFNGDFDSYATANTSNDLGSGMITASNSLYNGNIGAWEQNTQESFATGESNYGATAQVFQYDLLNRIRQSDFLKYGISSYASDNDIFQTKYEYDGNGNLKKLQRNGNLATSSVLMDNLSYTYPLNTDSKVTSNRLSSVSDAQSSATRYSDDIDGTSNYTYDGSGNLTYDDKEKVTIKWNAFGKVEEVIPDKATGGDAQKPALRYVYDASGNRILKVVNNVPYNGTTFQCLPENLVTTAYVRDASGNVMATYKRTNDPNNGSPLAKYTLDEQPIYGSSRIGLLNYYDKSIANVGYYTGEENLVTYWYDFRPRRLTEYQNWLQPKQERNLYTVKNAQNQNFTTQFATIQWKKSVYGGMGTYTVSSVNTCISGIDGNATFSSESDEGSLNFYGHVAKDYWGKQDVCLVYDAHNMLMPTSAGIKASSKAKAITVQYPGSDSKHLLFTIGTDSKLYYHVIDEQAIGNGISTDKWGDITSKNLLPTTNFPRLYGTQFNALEDRKGKRAFVYTLAQPSPLTGDNIFNIIVYEFYLNSKAILKVREHDTGIQVQCIDNGNGHGAIRISPDGTKLSVATSDLNAGWFNVQNTTLQVYKLGSDFMPAINDLAAIQAIPMSVPGMANADMDFSKDSRFLVAHVNGLGYNWGTSIGSEHTLWRYDMRTGLEQAPSTPYISRGLALQRAYDGFLYANTDGASPSQLEAYGSNGYTMQQLPYAITNLGEGPLPLQPHRTYTTPVPNGVVYTRTLGLKQYELTDHLGNVTAVLSDKYKLSSGIKKPDLLAYYNYYAFGMQMPGRKHEMNGGAYRYGFNGKEKDPEGMGGGGSTYDYGFRIYNPALGRFLSVDPIGSAFPFFSPYHYASNNPIYYIDADGLEGLPPSVYGRAYAESYIQVGNSISNYFKTNNNKANQLISKYERASGQDLSWVDKTLFYASTYLSSGAGDYSDANDVSVLATGKNISGVPATGGEKVAAGVGMIIPVVAGSVIYKFFKKADINLPKLKYALGKNDVDLRGTDATFDQALKIAYDRTGVNPEDFTPTKWGKNQYGKSVPVEYRADNGAEISVDFSHKGEGPDAPHIGWQTGGKRNSGGAERGHIILDEVPTGRSDKK